MSNRNPVESTGHRNPKVSLAMAITQGLGGPNLVAERHREMDSRLIFRPSAKFFFRETETCTLCELLDFRPCPEIFQGVRGSLASAWRT